jgi:hypothetical protein
LIKAHVSLPDLKPTKDGIAFEVIRALTRTARDAASEVKRETPGKFILRRSWVLKGIRSDAATRTNPTARVFSMDPYMLKQEVGETYSPSGSNVAIPAGARKSEKQSIPKAMFPRMLKSRSDVFKADIRGRGGLGIFQRTKGGLKLLYLLRKRKTTEPAWDFSQTVRETVERGFLLNFK